MQYITRNYKVTTYPEKIQSNPNYKIFEDSNLNDYLYMSDDSEWVSPFTDVNHIRKQSDIISHQYVLKYSTYPAMGYIIMRSPQDPSFCFWDIITVIRQYLNDVGYTSRYSDKELNKLCKELNPTAKQKSNWTRQRRIPPVIMATYFGGVDISAYADWYKYLDGKNISKNKTSAMIALYKDVFFTSQLTLAITSNDRKRKVPLRLQYRDTMALAPQGGLRKLGSIVKQPKLSTPTWDKEDNAKGLISDSEYNSFVNRGGYYKTHMRELLRNRPDDYAAYALGDSEITLKYLGFFLNQEKKVFQKGLISNLHIPATLTSLSDEIADHYANQPYYPNQAKDTLNELFANDDLDLYLRPEKFGQSAPKFANEWNKILNFAVNLDKAKSPDDFLARVNLQKRLITKLESFCAKGTITWQLTKDGMAYRSLSRSFPSLINFNKLYELNPGLNPLDFLEVDPPKITPYHPDFSSLPENLVKQYSHLSYHLRRNKHNELPNLSDILTYLWDKSVFANYHEECNQEIRIIKATPVYWLDKLMDYRYSRRGYFFLEPETAKAKHEAKAHDLISVQPDHAYNQGFKMACLAYIGGMNLCYNPGILKFKYTYDIDLKSSYVNAGHLIPDFRLDVEPIVDATNLSLQEFYQQIRPKMVNGEFTVGVCDVDYSLPSTIKRVPVGVKQAKKGATPRYVLSHNRACLTLTDVMNLISHHADVYFHRIIIPQQKKLTGDFDNLAPVGKMQDWTLTQRNLAKKKYGSSSAEQEFFKLLGNGGYGKTGQGLSEKTSRDFADNQTYFVPFSRSTNPFTASQYTSIARYQVNFLMDLINDLVPGSLIPSVTTDGFIFCTNTKLDTKQLLNRLRATAPKQWVTVNDRYFNGKFFELKSKLPGDSSPCSVDSPLINIRTRFNFSLDGRILALTGVLGVSYHSIYQNLIHDNITLDISSHRLASLVDMKHRTDYKHLLNEWTQPVKLSLGYDDTYRLTKFHDNGDGYGWYESRPFKTVDEAEIFKTEMKPLRSLFPLFNSTYAHTWLNFNNNIISFGNSKHIAWMPDDVQTSLRAKNYNDLVERYNDKYIPQVLLRYLHQHQNELDINRIYSDIFDSHYATISGFKQAIKRADGFVNRLVAIQQGWKEEFEQYKIGGQTNE